MRVTIEHFDAKHRNEVRHNVKCAINFSLEESAIIRERSLGSGQLVFEHGVVNHPAEADGSISPTMLYLGMRLLLIASVPFLYYGPPIATLCWAGAAGCFFYARQLENALDRVGQTSVSLAEVISDGAFTVTAFGSPLDAQKVESEILTNLEGLKSVLVASSEIPKTQSFEM